MITVEEITVGFALDELEEIIWMNALFVFCLLCRRSLDAEMLGVDDYIRKPFSMDRLLDSVKRLIG